MIQHIAPCVVDISHNRVPVAVHNLNHIALCILDVQICGSVVRHRRGTQAVVGKVQLVAAPGHLRQVVAQVREVVRCAVDRLGNALAVGIVAVGDAAAALAHGRQLASMLPGIRPRSVVQGVAYGIVGDGFPVIRRQQVRPISVAVGIGAACYPDVADKRRPRPSAGILIPPRRVSGPPGQEVFPRVAGFQIACVPRPAVEERTKYGASGR